MSAWGPSAGSLRGRTPGGRDELSSPEARRSTATQRSSMKLPQEVTAEGRARSIRSCSLGRQLSFHPELKRLHGCPCRSPPSQAHPARCHSAVSRKTCLSSNFPSSRPLWVRGWLGPRASREAARGQGGHDRWAPTCGKSQHNQEGTQTWAGPPASSLPQGLDSLGS